MSDFWFYFKIGLDHVLDYTAYDHVLFLIVLSVPYVFKDWRRVLLMVTLFTLGHTTSLLLAVYGVVRINRGLVEWLIPVTIFIAALYNVLPLAEFALGIEAAQIIITLIVLIIGFICQTIFRFSRRDWMMFISAVVIGMVIPMLIENYPW